MYRRTGGGNREKEREVDRQAGKTEKERGRGKREKTGRGWGRRETQRGKRGRGKREGKRKEEKGRQRGRRQRRRKREGEKRQKRVEKGRKGGQGRRRRGGGGRPGRRGRRGRKGGAPRDRPLRRTGSPRLARRRPPVRHGARGARAPTPGGWTRGRTKRRGFVTGVTASACGRRRPLTALRPETSTAQPFFRLPGPGVSARASRARRGWALPAPKAPRGAQKELGQRVTGRENGRRGPPRRSTEMSTASLTLVRCPRPFSLRGTGLKTTADFEKDIP